MPVKAQPAMTMSFGGGGGHPQVPRLQVNNLVANN